MVPTSKMQKMQLLTSVLAYIMASWPLSHKKLINKTHDNLVLQINHTSMS